MTTCTYTYVYWVDPVLCLFHRISLGKDIAQEPLQIGNISGWARGKKYEETDSRLLRLRHSFETCRKRERDRLIQDIALVRQAQWEVITPTRQILSSESSSASLYG